MKTFDPAPHDLEGWRQVLRQAPDLAERQQRVRAWALSLGAVETSDGLVVPDVGHDDAVIGALHHWSIVSGAGVRVPVSARPE